MANIFVVTTGTNPGTTGSTGPGSVVPGLGGMRHLWHAWDGTTWDIGNPSSPVRLNAGVQGLDDPDVDYYTSDSPGVDGTTDRGFRVSGRTVFWPLRIFLPAASQAWVDLDASFWRSLQPGRYGTWEVIQPNRVSRSLRLRMQDKATPTFTTDPALTGYQTYGVRLVCPDPYWVGDKVTRTFAPATSAPFFGPVFTITRSNTLSTATLTNPGDVEAWPVWTILGPTTAVTVGLDAHAITVPFTVDAGKAVIIDTDPRAQTAYDATVTTGPDGSQVVTSTGVERTGSLGTVDYAPIPPGASVPLTLTVTGAGSVNVSILPRYLRAW